MGNYDFSGWATRNDLLCMDGRTIRKDAFKDQDGEQVPLIWMHRHGDPNAVLGHAFLENRDEGVYAYGVFNDGESGQQAKKLVQNGDVRSLSIHAGQLKQVGRDVLHGKINELSLVLAGANPGAFIDFAFAHGDETEDTLTASWDENIVIYHSAESNKEDKKVEDNKEKSDKTEKKAKTIGEIVDDMTEEQQMAVYALLGKATEDRESDDDDEEGEDDMKHNAFDAEERVQSGVISHSAQEDILKMAKSSQIGSFKTALEIYANENNLQHDALSSGFTQNTGVEGNVTALFPEYKDVKPGAPELITSDQGWISVVMNKVHKSPISRIRTGQVDIRNIESLRAQGYKKGKQKAQTGNFELVRRTTDPQTVYVKSALHRDDIIDITDFDYVSYIYNIDRMQLNEELATAILFGDGRESGAEGKIEPDKIRPIWLDNELYTKHVDIDFEAANTELQGTNTGANFGENYVKAEAMVNTCLYSREQFKGSGTPDMFITPHMLNVMLLARDLNGRRIYSSKAELAAALNVSNIYTIEQMEGKTRVDDKQNTKKIIALIGNLADYSLGATKGGQVTHFTQFDIDFNQQKSLLETRVSGATTRIWSFIAIEELVSSTTNNDEDQTA